MIIQPSKHNHVPSKLYTWMVSSSNMNRSFLTYSLPLRYLRIKFDHLRHTFSYLQVLIEHLPSSVDDQLFLRRRDLDGLASHVESSKLIFYGLFDYLRCYLSPFYMTCWRDKELCNDVQHTLVHSSVNVDLMEIIRC